MSKPILSYWDQRGLAEGIRLMMEYAGMDYDQIKWECGNDEAWKTGKHEYGLDFPNLPYYIEGDFKLSESWAIYRYIASKFNLISRDPQKDAICMMFQGVVDKFVWDFIKVCYHTYYGGKLTNYDELKHQFRKNSLEPKLDQINKFLDGKKYSSGNEITYIDFAFFEAMDQQRTMYTDILDNFPNIFTFMKRISELEKIAAYRSSSKFQKFPIFNAYADWRG